MEVLYIIFAFIVGFAVGNAGKSRPVNDSSEIQYKTGQIEKKINLLLDNLGIDYGQKTLSAVTSVTTPDDEIIMLLRQNKKINAIKLYRERTGVGLKEAKDAVEEIERRL